MKQKLIKPRDIAIYALWSGENEELLSIFLTYNDETHVCSVVNKFMTEKELGDHLIACMKALVAKGIFNNPIKEIENAGS